MAAVEEEQERMEVPDPPGMLVEVRAHASWVELVAVARSTVPVKPLSGATVIVDEAAVLTVVVTLVGLAVTLKSLKTKVTLVEFVVDPLVAVTVAMSV